MNLRLLGPSLVACVACALAVSGARAQVVERNLPPEAEPGAPAIIVPNLPVDVQDVTPIGPPLRGLVLLAPGEPVRTGAADGLDMSGAPRLQRDGGALPRFLGQPLSRRLIAEIEAEIARQYRRAGYPFVSVSTPEQEITSGVLQIRVIEFTLGQVAVNGVAEAAAEDLLDQIRVASGEPISSAELSEDLEWLNRYPFRRVEAVFSPGGALGESDLRLDVQTAKPWTVYGGFANSGTPGTGTDRYFLGAQIGDLLGRDSLLAYQVTGSSDVLTDNGDLFGGLPHPRYISHALQATLPARPRTAFTAGLGLIETNQDANPFALRQKTAEGAFGYESALSNVAPGLAGAGAARIGVEARRQTEITFFGGVEAQRVSVEIYQLYLGYRRISETARGRSAIDLSLHLSPGGIGDANSAQRALLQSRGRIDDMQYAYLRGSYDREMRLANRFSLALTLASQFASEPLPATEQGGLGGANYVRGYQLDDGAFDRMILARSELHAPPLRVYTALDAVDLDPFAFFDIGAGRDLFARTEQTAVSTGLGVNARAFGRLRMNFTLAHALKDAAITRSGDWRLETRIALSY